MSEKKKKILKIIGTILIFAGMVAGIYFLLKALGVTDQESLQKIISGTGAWGPIVFFLLQIVVTTLLCVIPGTNMTFLILAGILFENLWVALPVAVLGVWTSSVLMFMVGDKLGEKVVIKLVGEKELRKAQDLIDTKSKIYLPIMFLFPFFPDDALCMAAGLTKMKYRYFIIIVAIFRTIGAVTSVLTGFYHKGIAEILDIANFRLIDWIILINIVLFDIYIIYKFTRWLEKKINQHKEKREIEEVIEEARKNDDTKE